MIPKHQPKGLCSAIPQYGGVPLTWTALATQLACFPCREPQSTAWPSRRSVLPNELSKTAKQGTSCLDRLAIRVEIGHIQVTTARLSGNNKPQRAYNRSCCLFRDRRRLRLQISPRHQPRRASLNKISACRHHESPKSSGKATFPMPCQFSSAPICPINPTKSRSLI